MEDERLIELVRENTVLYDLSHAKYMDSKYKNNLWNKIGSKMKLDGAICKVRWNNIRDNYRKSLKKTETKSGQKRTNIKLYKYYEQLHFLKIFFKERQAIQSVNSEEEDSESQTAEDKEDDQSQNILPISILSSPDMPTFTSHVAYSPSSSLVPTTSPQYVLTSTQSPSYVPTPSSNYVSTPSPSPESTSSPPTSKKKRGAKDFPQKTAASSLMEYVLQKNQVNAERTQHPVDAFLNGIAPTLKNLNQYYLHLAKSEIFAAVQKYEMKMMTEQNVTLLPGVDITNVPINTVVLQNAYSSQSISNSTAAPVITSQAISKPNSPQVMQDTMTQSIFNSTALADIDNNAQIYHQDSNVQDFVRNYSDT